MNQAPNGIIPFGKYKGQPLEVLENDPQYAEWIAQQQWAKERYPAIVNVIINKFGENEETPDHNAMQAKFISKGYCAAAAIVLGGFDECSNSELETFPSAESLKSEQESRRNDWNRSWPGELTLEISTPNPIKKLSSLIESVAFESNAVDVAFKIAGYGSWASLAFRLGDRWSGEEYRFRGFESTTMAIELKPVVGDDYPAILRQMRNSGSRCLIYEEYIGIGVSEQVFRTFFATQGIRVASVLEIETDAFDRAEKKIEEINNRCSEFRKFFSCWLEENSLFLDKVDWRQ